MTMTAFSTSTCPLKHPRSSPTCLTPRQCQKRVPLRELAASPPNLTQRLEPRWLSYQSDSSHPVKEKWTPAKTSALIEFILFYTTGTYSQEGDPFLDSRMRTTQLIENKSSSAYIVSFLLWKPVLQ